MNQKNILEINKLNLDETFRAVSFNLEVKKDSIHSILFNNDQLKNKLLEYLKGTMLDAEANLIYKGRELENKNIAEFFQKKMYLINQYSAINPERDPMGIFKFNKKENQENKSTVFPEMTIAENIFFGREPVKKFLFFKSIDNQKIIEKTTELLNLLEVELYPTQKMIELTPLEKQLVEMLKAFSYGVEIILIDQALTGLADKEKQLFFNFMQKAKEKGFTIIYFTKEIEEVFSAADFVSILKKDRNNERKKVSELEYNELALLLMGR